MRRAGSAVAFLGLLLLTSCAVTPPVLGGRPGETVAPPAGDVLLDEQVAALLILNDPESDRGATDLPSYRERVLASTPEVAPVSCRDSAAPLVLPASDEAVEGTVFLPPVLFREATGPDLLVTQYARRFPTLEDAAAFLAALRAARVDCPAFDTPDGAHSEQRVVDGAFTVDAVGVEVVRTAPGAEPSSTFGWVLVHDNVAIAVEAELLDDDARGILDGLAEEYAARLVG